MLTIKRISQELRGTLKRVIDGSSLRSFYGIRGKRQSTRRPVDLQRGTTMFASTVRSLCINSLLPHCCPSSCPCTPYAHAYVRLCPCILINTLLTPRPRHINHETMENAVGGGPTGVDLSIPLSCIPLPPSLSCTLDVCHVRHPWQQWGISLSLSLTPTPVCAPSLLEKFPPVFIAKFHERGQDCIAPRGFRSRNRPLLTGRRGSWLCGDSTGSSRHFLTGEIWIEKGRDLVEDVAGNGDMESRKEFGFNY